MFHFVMKDFPGLPMPRELDGRLAEILDELRRPGCPFETGFVERDGLRLASFRHAPPSLPALFDRQCRQLADREFLVDGDFRLTFGEVHALAAQVAAGLVSRHGVRPGDRVGIAARNSASWVVAYMAVLMAGGCATLLNGWWTGPELARGVAHTGCSLVIADAERGERLAGAGCQVPILPLAHTHPANDFAAWTGEADAARLPKPAPDDIATILFSSGSTGAPKAAMSDHRAVVHAAMLYAMHKRAVLLWLEEAGSAPEEPLTELACVPFFHAVGQVTVLLQSFIHGRRLVVMPRWDATEALRLIERERVTGFTGVPLMVHELASHPELSRFAVDSCRTIGAGGSPWPVSQIDNLRAAFPRAWPLQAYGLTESNGVGCGNYAGNFLARPASTGRAKGPLVDVAIFDSTGQPLPSGAAGEIALRSICNTRGYWDDPEATAALFARDGWLLTGDVGYLDADGFLHVLDRRKNIIIRGGENISCAEVEEALLAHPAVENACVFGVPDARYGEVPVAVVFGQVDEAGLATHLAGCLARFKLPERIVIAEAPLPRLGAGKIDRQAIKARYAPDVTGAISRE